MLALCRPPRSQVCFTALMGLISSMILSITILSAAQPLSQWGEGPAAGGDLFINGTKFEDRNGDGFLEEGEPGMPGWTVHLVGSGVRASATTDILGRYSFQGLMPGRYTVYEDHVDGWGQTSPGCHAYQVDLRDRSARNMDFGDRQNSSGVLVYRGYTLMHLSRDELREIMAERKKAPKAPLLSDAEIETRHARAAGSRFSLLDCIEYCPAERDQGRCGNCWIWAGTGALEVDLAFRKNIKDRISIQYLNSYYWSCNGGALKYFANLLNATKRAVPWSNANAQWHDGGVRCRSKSCVPVSFISTTPCYPVLYARAMVVPTNYIGREAAISNIKNVLHQGRAINFAFQMPTGDEIEAFVDHWQNHSESDVMRMDGPCSRTQDEERSAGHVVLCVGYDETDPGRRYWIMLNSWGTTPERPRGLFNVDMDMNYDCAMVTPDGLFTIFQWEALDVHYPDTTMTDQNESSAGRGSGELYSPLGSMDGLIRLDGTSRGVTS